MHFTMELSLVQVIFWLFTLDSISILDIRKTFYTCTFYTNNISNINEYIFWSFCYVNYLTRRINPDLRFLKISLVSVILFSSEWVRSFYLGAPIKFNCSYLVFSVSVNFNSLIYWSLWFKLSNNILACTDI